MTSPRLTSLAPQFLVDDLARSMAYYRKLGFTFGEPWDGFYAIGTRDGLELHLKKAPKIEAFYARCVAEGVSVLKPLAATEWGTKDFALGQREEGVDVLANEEIAKVKGRRPCSEEPT